MASTLDSAIIKALFLDPTVTRMGPHGGSGFSSTFKITTQVANKEKLYFVKTGTGKDAQVMFAGEHTSLNALHNILPSLCPQSHANGPLSSTPNSHFLATDFLHLKAHSSSSTSSAKTKSGVSLASKLALLHTTPAPIPPGYSSPQFGFPLPTFCGSTLQPNDYSPSWAHFFATRRLKAVLEAGEKAQGQDEELRKLVEKIADAVVPRLLGEGHLKLGMGGEGKGIVPVVVHGDLWNGNHGTGSIGEDAVLEEVVFDPSSCYAHSEYELGIMRMFGGYGKAFFEEYHRLKPKDEPVEEYEDRMALYELYHYLNHNAIFGGGGYRSSAISIMRRLNKKYASVS